MAYELQQKLAITTMNALGSPEHKSVTDELIHSEKFLLSIELHLSLLDVCRHHSYTVERNLDRITIPEKPIWIEWRAPMLTGHGGAENAVTGCLVAPDPNSVSGLFILTGWFDGTMARHSYATAHIDVNSIYGLARLSRRQLSVEHDEVMERIMSFVNLSLCASFEEELRILYPKQALPLDAVYRDASGEIPLCLAALIALNTSKGVCRYQDRLNRTVLDLVPSKGRIRKMLPRTKKRGFAPRLGLSFPHLSRTSRYYA
ncbi:hypothetical protein ACQU0X_26970 [Pseudovibrio ascidiaceicola]|uniref:hypothetical protein n=1 Tax=Pseudovibrio ascidiaceicola TaxID=285279 RepID=UPI003D35B934